MVFTPKESVKLYRDNLTAAFRAKKFVVFLCGPTIPKQEGTSLPEIPPEAACRACLQRALEEEGFEVVLGEDEGLENLQSIFKMDAQTNELKFIERNANAIVLIAASPGSFSELGLFSYHKAKTKKKLDFILLIDKKYKGIPSYINLGPAELINSYGKVLHIDYDDFSPAEIITRLSRRRAFEIE